MKVESNQKAPRRVRMLLIGCAVFLNLTVELQGATDRMHVSEAERSAETKRLAGLGLAGDPLLGAPYALPLESRSYVIPGAWFHSAFQADHSKVSASALRADLPILRAAMEEAYAGWKPAEAAGWDWAAWFADWDKMLEKAGDQELPFADAFAPYAKLAQFKIDNHSGFVGSGMAGYSSLSRCAILDGAPTQPCTQLRNAFGGTITVNPLDKGQQPKAALAADGRTRVWYISYPDCYGTVAAAKCGDKWITVQPASNPSDADRLGSIEALAGTNRDVPVRRRLTPEITYYRLPTFTVANNELLQTLLSAEGPSLDRDKLTIVDLRGNGGGDAPLDWFGHWTKSAVKKNADFPREIRRSKLYPALRWNYDSVSLLYAQPPLPDSLRHDKQADLDDLLNPAKASNGENFPGEWTYASHHFPAKPKLLVLVDNRCGSDGELLAYILASAEGSVVAGVNTAGVLQHMQPGYLLLPHTDLVFRMSLGLSNVYGDNRSTDGYGLDVDILLPTPESNSPEGILRLAKILIQTADAAAAPQGNPRQDKTAQTVPAQEIPTS